MSASVFPPLPLEAWEETKITLHLMTQIIGKVRLATSPKLNHFWHAPLYVSARGLTTRSIPQRRAAFEMELDFIEHALVIRSSEGQTRKVPLAETTIAGFYRDTLGALRGLGIVPNIVGEPFDPSKTKSSIPFAEDTEHGSYDREAATKFWRVLVGIEPILRTFRGRYVGKSSPVHFFWHSFDLAVTRFSGRKAKLPPDVDPVTAEAYSHEVISAGFWVGDDNVPEPAFYAYVAPEPKGLRAESIRPSKATWQDTGESSMALYLYNNFRVASDPEAALLEFLQSTFEAGAKLTRWPADTWDT